jgi:hypothetical protein
VLSLARPGTTAAVRARLVVWHHDWRTPAELVRTGADTQRLCARPGRVLREASPCWRPQILPFLLADLRRGLRSVIVGALRGEPRWQNPNREMLLSLLLGLAFGWFEARSLARGPKGGKVKLSWEC